MNIEPDKDWWLWKIADGERVWMAWGNINFSVKFDIDALNKFLEQTIDPLPPPKPKEESN